MSTGEPRGSRQRHLHAVPTDAGPATVPALRAAYRAGGFHPVLLAEPADAHTVAATIAAAFRELPVTRWLVPDDGERQAVLYRNFRIFVEHAIEYGTVWTIPDRRAAAVWFPRDGKPLPPIEDYDWRVTHACGPYAGNFRRLDVLFDAHHPAASHRYLMFLAVDPALQGRGIGSALLAEEHHHLDQPGGTTFIEANGRADASANGGPQTPVAAYLEATSDRAREFYLSHDYRDHGPPIAVADGVQLWPMWRDPQPLPSDRYPHRL